MEKSKKTLIKIWKIQNKVLSLQSNQRQIEGLELVMTTGEYTPTYNNGSIIEITQFKKVKIKEKLKIN